MFPAVDALKLKTARALGLAAAIALCCACGSEPEKAGATPDATTLEDIGFAGADVPPIPDTGSAAGGADTTSGEDGGTGADTAPPVDDLASLTLTAPTALKVGEAAKITLSAKTLLGKDADTSAATFSVDGQTLPEGAQLQHDPATPPAFALFAHSDKGAWTLVALRPVDVKLTATLGATEATAQAIAVTWPEQHQARFVLPDAGVTVEAGRLVDDPNTIRLHGKKTGAGGGTFTLRFPVTAASGDCYDIEKPPSKGGLSFKGAVADLAGLPVTLAKGRVHVTETGKGLLQGWILGLSASLKPLAATFSVQRQGEFGIDVLDDGPLQLGKSDSPTPETGHHHSRLSLGAIGLDALVLHRHIEGKYKAHLERRALHPVTGKLTELTPIAPDLTAYTGFVDKKPGPFNAAVGFATVADTAPYFATWEGRAEKGHSKPHGLWIRAYDDKHKPVSEITPLSTDPCHGQCRPVSVLAAGQLHVLWRGTDNKLKLRRAKTLLDQAKVAFVDAGDVELASGAEGVQVAAVQDKVLAAWRDKDGVHHGLVSGGKLKNKAKLPGTNEQTSLPGLAPVVFSADSGDGVFALATCRGGKLHVAKLSKDGVALGNELELGECFADQVLAAGGALGQAAIVWRQPGNATYLVHARKVTWDGPGSDGKQLGADWQVAKVITGSFIDIALTRVPASNAFVVGWSGDFDSAGVHLRRFR